MDDPLLVRFAERLGDLAGDLEARAQRQRAVREPVGERRSLDQLEHQRADRVGLLDAVDRGDVGVVQARKEARFALEQRQVLRVARDLVRQDLDRHLAPEPGVGGAEDLTHPPFAELAADLVGPEPRARLEPAHRRPTSEVQSVSSVIGETSRSASGSRTRKRVAVRRDVVGPAVELDDREERLGAADRDGARAGLDRHGSSARCPGS